MVGTARMEWHQTPGNHVFGVFDTIPLQPLPQARSPQLRSHQPPVLYTVLTGFMTVAADSICQLQHVSGGLLPIHTGVRRMLDSSLAQVVPLSSIISLVNTRCNLAIWPCGNTNPNPIKVLINLPFCFYKIISC